MTEDQGASDTQEDEATQLSPAEVQQLREFIRMVNDVADSRRVPWPKDEE